MNDYLNLEELENSVKPTLMASFEVFLKNNYFMILCKFLKK